MLGPRDPVTGERTLWCEVTSPFLPSTLLLHASRPPINPPLFLHETASVVLMFIAANSVARKRNTYGTATRRTAAEDPHARQTTRGAPAPDGKGNELDKKNDVRGLSGAGRTAAALF